jgi:hypothetical protein
VDAWVYCDDLGNGWEIYGNIEPFSVSGLFGWVAIWRPGQFLPDSPTGVHVELRVEGEDSTADEAKMKAAQAIERLQAMVAADPQMLIRLQSPAGGV